MTNKVTPYHKAIHSLFYRYFNMATGIQDAELAKFVIELHDGCLEGAPIEKLNRWLGYIQGVLITKGATTVQAERDFTRPIFRPLDFPE